MSTANHDDWRKVAAWLEGRAIVADVRGADDFRNLVLNPLAQNAVHRAGTGKPLADVFKYMNSISWWTGVPSACGDGRAVESWAAMRDRLMNALLELQALGGRV